MRTIIVLAILAAAGTLAAEPAPAALPRRASQQPLAATRRSFTGVRSWSQYVAMRDGVRLAADVHLPKGLAAGERTATILHMSRYYRSVDIRGPWKPLFGAMYPITERDIREAFVKAGFSWVDVDVRGAGASFGHIEYPLSAEEVRDGAELIDWIVAQPWSAGTVGATGSSYDGALASLLVRNHHPALKAIAPRFSGWDSYGDIFLPGGLQVKSLLHEWSQLIAALDRGRLTDVFGWTAGVLTSGVRPVDARVLPQAVAEHASNVNVEYLLGSAVYRDDTDPRGGPMTMDDFSAHALGAAAADVPIYAYAGWFDAALPRGQIRQYLANRNPASRLRLGPWFHAGQFNASPDAASRKNDIDHAKELIRFFDYHLRGGDTGFTSDAPVQYYTMGEERWKAAPAWPPPGAVTQSLFLAPEGTLSMQSPSVESAHDRYRVDEAATSGAGSRWGLVVGTGIRRGYADRRERDRTLLTYTTHPLEQDVEVTGHPILRLFLSANATDGALFAYLEDVRPNGEVRYVTEGDFRIIHRKVGTSPVPGDPVPFHSYLRADNLPLVIDEVAEVDFDLLPTSFQFRAGHAIRLAIAGVDAGVFDAPLLASPLIYDVHRGRSTASRLELPTYATGRARGPSPQGESDADMPQLQVKGHSPLARTIAMGTLAEELHRQEAVPLPRLHVARVGRRSRADLHRSGDRARNARDRP